ncbi:BLOC-1-related complex subunit 8 isoform X1 [Fundulus heteroclitus]|uniref:BLOC-1-related complex subunit 8 isoform X1 n=1 Tax=Fundulus heteroclitus TaxID=8078 RepID=UPI00165C1539|nr:BLOC-1-related complex subunit 8 isoform X1 [Fundulus heteroclitus]
MEDQEMQLKVRRVSDKFTESMYVLANEPSVALYRLQEHVRRSLPELVQHKETDYGPRNVEGRGGEAQLWDVTRHPELASTFSCTSTIRLRLKWGQGETTKHHNEATPPSTTTHLLKHKSLCGAGYPSTASFSIRNTEVMAAQRMHCSLKLDGRIRGKAAALVCLCC